MLPSLQLLEQIVRKVKSTPNKRKESKRGVHYGLFLLSYKSGLRISEAVSFDLDNKTRQGLYRIKKSKGKKERLVYVPKEVIWELKKHNWKPNQTNRWNFYHFLQKIKRELNLPANIELTPHTLRRAFATYHAEIGLPLPILQKLLGHSSIRTTALYWQNIYQEPNDDIGSILIAKKWLENRKPPQPPTETASIPTTEPTLLIEPPTKPIINSPPINAEPLPVATNTKPQPLTTRIQSTEKSFSNIITETKSPIIIKEQLPVIISQKEQPTKNKQILLEKIRNLEKQLERTQTENKNLTTKLTQSEALVQSETQRANYYQQQLKTIAKSLYQWQKINYYQQLEQGRKDQEAKIEQSLPFKLNK
jgi:hypothetical protein